MSCEKCQNTDCILASDEEVGEKGKIFADLRFDLENNQLDINFGFLGKNNRPLDSYWSDAVNIKFCPFCGRKLDEVI